MAVTHTKVSTIADSGNTDLVQPSDWNADHAIGTFLEGGGTGVLGDYDIEIGSANYGSMRLGGCTIDDSSLNVGDLDLRGSLLIAQTGAQQSKIEFLFAASGNDIRCAIPDTEDGHGNYFAGGAFFAGPAVLNDDIVELSYWQSQGIFDNLTMTTASTGSDVGVQGSLEVEVDIFTDSIKESTTDAGVTIHDAIVVGDGGPTIRSGSGDPEGSVTASPGSLYMRTTGTVYLKASGSGNTGWVEGVTFTA